MKKRVLSIVVSLSLTLGLLTTLRTTQNSKANGYDIGNPRIEEDGTVTWDCVYFGNYWQNDTNGDGVADQNDDKEPIKWRVLSVNGDDAYLLADKGLDVQPYDNHEGDIVWENSILRKWLNEDFYNIAFNNAEQTVIVETEVENEEDKCIVKDKVSLLSLTDACNSNYGFNSDSSVESETRAETHTAYTKNLRAYSNDNGNGDWWLRSYYQWTPKHIYKVASYGDIKSVNIFFLNQSNITVRPCLHLNLSSDTWRKADTVTATGGTFPTPTPEPTPTPTVKPSPTPKATPKPTSTTKATAKPTQFATMTPIPTSTTEPSAEPKVTNEPKTVAAPSKVKSLSAKNNKKKTVTLSWKKVKGATGYQIQYAANTAFAKKKVKNTKKTKLVIKNLKKKKIYSFRVRAYKVNNSVKICGNWCKAKKVKIKK